MDAGLCSVCGEESFGTGKFSFLCCQPKEIGKYITTVVFVGDYNLKSYAVDVAVLIYLFIYE